MTHEAEKNYGKIYHLTGLRQDQLDRMSEDPTMTPLEKWLSNIMRLLGKKLDSGEIEVVRKPPYNVEDFTE